MVNFVCQISGEKYPVSESRWRSDQGALLDLEYDFRFDPDKVKDRKADLWRYREAFPLMEGAEIVSFGEGMTPMKRVEIGGRDVWMKLDFLFPSGSYKDRGATVMISQAAAMGVRSVVQDSSGNAGCAVAHYCARAGIACEIFVPASTSPAKLVQIGAYGAALSLVPGSREDTANAAMQAADHAFYASHVWNPFFFQGTKTFAYEVCEQLDWQAPDTVILPAGNGTLVIGAHIGFGELFRAGIINHMPKIIGVQAAHCAPLWCAQQEQEFVSSQETIAEGIAIAMPQRARQMLEIVRESGGFFLAVEEEEIRESLKDMCQKGFFIEPTSAAVVAGVQTYVQKYAQKTERIVSVFTGHGLKASEKIEKLLR